MPEGAVVVRKAGGWILVIGILFIVLGLMAIAEPMVAGLAVALLVGWVLVFAGIAHLIAAFGGGRVIWQLVLAALYLMGGFYFVTHPLLGLGSLTLFLAGILLAEGVLEVMAYVQTRNQGGSAWGLVNAAVTLVLCVMVWGNWPSSSTWAIGTLVGVNLLMTGISRVMFGAAARGFARRAGA